MKRLLAAIRSAVLGTPAFRAVWGRVRRVQQDRRYLEWTTDYRKVSRRRPGFRHPGESFAAARRCLPGTPAGRRRGGVHTAIVALTKSWGAGLVHEAEELGRASVFDWEEHGFREGSPDFWETLPRLQQELLSFLERKNAEQPVDWVLLTTTGSFVLKDTIRRIREDLGIPVVSQSLDDRHTFRMGTGPHGQDRGQVDVGVAADVVWTSSSVATDWYAAEGGRPVFLPEGFSPRLTPRLPRKELFDVGFLGQRTPPRDRLVTLLRRAGLTVQARGWGWPEGSLDLAGMGLFFSQNKVNLGIGGVNYSMKLTTLKGRDFEVPGAGQTYLTTFDPDLALCFRIGEEIACYGNEFHMVDLAYELARDEQWRTDMADKAYARSMAEHRWLHRFEWLLTNLGIMSPSPDVPPPPVVTDAPARR
ncbi:MAG: glycosyltransferase [Actinomycetota bacterium]|nr:glycosyltransferase [Actinomycetota bacterium]